jgi:hypothetical protein
LSEVLEKRALAQEGKQYPHTTPGSVTRLFRAPWRVTDRVEIPPDAVSGCYEAKLEIYFQVQELICGDTARGARPRLL